MKPAILLFALTSIACAQGSLTPPGPPGLTMRSLDEIEPRIPLNQTTTPGDATCVFKITKAGSYMLTGNIKPPAGKHGILVALLLPGVVDVDMKGFTIDGAEAGASASGVLCNSEVVALEDDFSKFRNGTIRNFAGGSCLDPATSTGRLELEHVHILGGGAGVNTAGPLRLSDVVISSVTGTPVTMGSDSSLTGVTIRTSHPGISKIIACTGTGYKLYDVMVSSVMAGSSRTTAIEMGPDSVIHGMSLRLSDAVFTGPVLSNTSGFTEVSGLNMELNNVTAPTVANSFSFGASQTGSILGTTYGGNGHAGYAARDAGSGMATGIIAKNCAFSSAFVIIPAAMSSSDGYFPRFTLAGTSSAPSILRVEADNFTGITDHAEVVATATVSGAVIDVAASGVTIRASIRGGNVGVRLSSGTGHTVEGCSLIGLLVPAQAIKIESGVTNSLVRNNTAARLAAGGVLVQNNGGASNFIAPIITTPAQLNANTNPFANIVH